MPTGGTKPKLRIGRTCSPTPSLDRCRDRRGYLDGKHPGRSAGAILRAAAHAGIDPRLIPFNAVLALIRGNITANACCPRWAPSDRYLLLFR